MLHFFCVFYIIRWKFEGLKKKCEYFWCIQRIISIIFEIIEANDWHFHREIIIEFRTEFLQFLKPFSGQLKIYSYFTLCWWMSEQFTVKCLPNQHIALIHVVNLNCRNILIYVAGGTCVSKRQQMLIRNSSVYLCFACWCQIFPNIWHS